MKKIELINLRIICKCGFFCDDCPGQLTCFLLDEDIPPSEWTDDRIEDMSDEKRLIEKYGRK